MTGALLRTGSLDVFHPLGAEGNPVHAAAAQLRAAIGRRLGQDVVDTFAIPQRNEDGDTIDWYAPRSGPVVPWSAATEEERTRAKDLLLEVRGRVEELGRRMSEESDPQRQAFARLLQHVTVFPDEEHVYLVDDRPVVTFWGFRHHNAPAYSGAMLNPDALGVDAASDQSPRRVPWWWWLLGALLLLALLFFLLRACVREPTAPETGAEEEAPTEVAEESAVLEEPGLEPEASPEPLPEEPAAVEPILAPEEPVAEPVIPDTPVQGADDRSLVIDRDLVERDAILREGASVAAPPDVVPGQLDLPPDSVGELVGEEPSGAVEGEVQVEDEVSADVEVVEDLDASPQVETGVETEEAVPLEADQAVPEEAAADPLQQEQPAEVQPETPPETAEEAPAPEIDQTAADDPAVEQEPPAPEISQDEAQTAPEQQPESQQPSDAPGEPAGQEDTATPDGAQAGEPAPEPTDPSGPQPAPADQKSPAPGAGTVPQQPLTIPAGAVTSGSIRFTDGGWRTSTSLQDAKGLPIDMRYQLKNGVGKVELKRHDGSVCSSDVKAVMQGGKLMIDSAADITCPDGTNFGRPRMECTPGQDGRADCAGRYPTGESFSVDMGKAP